MNVLFVTNEVRKYALVYKNVIDILVKQGHSIIWAGNFSKLNSSEGIPCILENIPIKSNPFNKNNKTALKMISSFLTKYDINCVYCSTPIGSTLARLAARKRRNIKIIYAAHGFLFFKHSKKWYLNPFFKLHEKKLAKYTDCLITITNEDFEYAKNHLRLRNNGKVYMVKGAGIELPTKLDIDIKAKRESLGVKENDFVLISAGFLNKNKNNIVILKALKLLNDKRIKYLVCGEGEESSELVKYVKNNGLEDNVVFLGYRTDMDELYCSSNAFLMPSFREGVPRSMLEAMAFGLPCIGSNIRGISDLIGNDGRGGYLCNPSKPQEFANAVKSLMSNNTMFDSSRNIATAKQYSKEVVCSQLEEILSVETA